MTEHSEYERKLVEAVRSAAFVASEDDLRVAKAVEKVVLEKHPVCHVDVAEINRLMSRIAKLEGELRIVADLLKGACVHLRGYNAPGNLVFMYEMRTRFADETLRDGRGEACKP
jgi:hypothetical protein